MYKSLIKVYHLIYLKENYTDKNKKSVFVTFCSLKKYLLLPRQQYWFKLIR